MSESRRDVLRCAVALGAPSLCVANERSYCCSVPDAPASGVTIQPGLLRLDLRRVPGLSKTGSAIRVVDETRKLRLLIVHPEKGTFVALDQKCTHGGGPLTYVHKLRVLHCTCWGHSRFDLEGRVLRWPNKQQGRPVRAYSVTRRGDVLEVAVEGLA